MCNHDNIKGTFALSLFNKLNAFVGTHCGYHVARIAERFQLAGGHIAAAHGGVIVRAATAALLHAFLVSRTVIAHQVPVI